MIRDYGTAAGTDLAGWEGEAPKPEWACSRNGQMTASEREASPASTPRPSPSTLLSRGGRFLGTTLTSPSPQANNAFIKDSSQIGAAGLPARLGIEAFSAKEFI